MIDYFAIAAQALPSVGQLVVIKQGLYRDIIKKVIGKHESCRDVLYAETPFFNCVDVLEQRTHRLFSVLGFASTILATALLSPSVFFRATSIVLAIILTLTYSRYVIAGESKAEETPTWYTKNKEFMLAFLYAIMGLILSISSQTIV